MLGPISWAKLNVRIIRTFNSCNPTIFQDLLTDIMTTMPEEQRTKIFTSKLYIWNILRPRDFYRMASIWVTDMVGAGELDHAETMIKLVLSTTNNESACKNFIWVITKRVPLLTEDTIRFMSPEKIHSLLSGDKELICDQVMRPIVDEIMSLRTRIESLEVLTDL